MNNKPNTGRKTIDKIQKNADMNIYNMEFANEIISKTSGSKREEALEILFYHNF